MVFRSLLAGAFCLLTCNATAAGAGFYVSGEGGGSILTELRLNGATTTHNEGFSGGYVVGGAFGYDSGYGVRIELNSLYQRNDLSTLDKTPTKGHISSTGVMFNATYDVFADERFSPYFGVGFGMENMGGQVGAMHGRDWVPAYQGEIGLRQTLSRHFALFGEYRYLQSAVVPMSDGTTTAHQHFEDNILLAGLRISLF